MILFRRGIWRALSMRVCSKESSFENPPLRNANWARELGRTTSSRGGRNGESGRSGGGSVLSTDLSRTRLPVTPGDSRVKARRIRNRLD